MRVGQKQQKVLKVIKKQIPFTTRFFTVVSVICQHCGKDAHISFFIDFSTIFCFDITISDALLFDFCATISTFHFPFPVRSDNLTGFFKFLSKETLSGGLL